MNVFNITSHLEADSSLHVILELQLGEMFGHRSPINVILCPQDRSGIRKLLKWRFSPVNGETRADDYLGFLTDEDWLFEHEKGTLEIICFFAEAEVS